MSEWTARFVALGARMADGGLIGLPTLKGLTRLLPGTPVCAFWEGRELHHYAGERISCDLFQKAVVGSVLGVRLLSDGVYGLLSINRAALDHYFLDVEQEGRLLETRGLSLRGHAEPVSVGCGEPLLMFTKLDTVDIVERPLAGGVLLQSDVAAAAGLACPLPPKLTPQPRPAKNSGGAPTISRPAPRPARESTDRWPIRVSSSAPLETEFRVIAEGADY